MLSLLSERIFAFRLGATDLDGGDPPAVHREEIGPGLDFGSGLELQPARLWRLRREVFGLGGAQVLATASLLTLCAYALGLGMAAAVVVGFALAMSSTALGLQLLAERGELSTRHGRGAFATLLFQDLSVIPFLALIPLLAPQAAGLLALSVGLSRMFRDDLQQLEVGMTLYDALYRWARDGFDEGHDWPEGRAQ